MLNSAEKNLKAHEISFFKFINKNFKREMLYEKAKICKNINIKIYAAKILKTSRKTGRAEKVINIIHISLLE